MIRAQLDRVEDLLSREPEGELWMWVLVAAAYSFCKFAEWFRRAVL
jgi:hypothetical protein